MPPGAPTDLRFEYAVRAPPGGEALVVLPDASRHEVEAGRHRDALALAGLEAGRGGG
jgi:hypothetical protein